MLSDEGKLPLLELTGDAARRGLDHGRAFADAIKRNVEVYLRRFEASGFDREAAMAEAKEWEVAIARAAPDYATEMRGIADGAGLAPHVVALLNARYEIAFTLFGRDARSRDGPAKEPDGCTTVGLLPVATANHHTILAQNWDWLAALRGNCLLLQVRRNDKPDLICLTEAGIVGGKMGVNEAGIGLVENGLASDYDGVNPYQKPFHVRCREILDAETLSDAIMPVVQTLRVCSANFVIGSASSSGEVIDLETSPNAVSAIHPREGIVTHSNHFIDSRHGNSQMERISPSTLFRAARVERLLRADVGHIGILDIHRALTDHLSSPHGICRHPDERQPIEKRTMTLASVVLDLDDRAIWVTEGPPCESQYRRHALSESPEI